MKDKQKREQKVYKITLPANKETVKNLKCGDIIYLTGIIATGRDLVHKRIIEYNKKGSDLPKEFSLLKNSAIFHMGPIVKKLPSGNYQIVSGGPTTSSRMNPFQTQVNRIIGNRFVIGKGGMAGVSWEDPVAIYLKYPGGVGALTTKFIEEVVDVVWIELGPEASWFLKVKN